MRVILQGDRSQAAKYLRYAKQRLEALKEYLDVPFSHVTRAGNALIRLASTGDDDTILIRAEGDEFFSLSNGKIRASRHVRAGAFKGIPFSPPEAPEFASSPRPLGGGSCVYLARSGDLLTGYVYLSPGGKALKKIVEGGAAFFLNTAYTGLVRDDGKPISKELQSIGYTPAGFGVFSEGSALVGQTNGFVGAFPLGIPAALGFSPFGVNSTTGPLFCGEKTSLVTISFPLPTRRIIFHSADGGRNWAVAFDEADLPAGVSFLRPPFLMDANGTVGLWILDTNATPHEVQLWRSTDRGASFGYWKTPPTDWQTMVNFNSRTFFTATLGAGAFLVLATKSVPPTVWTQIARTLDYGETWEIFDEEFPGTDATSYAVLMRVYETVKDEPTDTAPNPAKARIVVPVFQAGEGYFCYLSDDGGETWRLGPMIDPSTAAPTFTSPFVVEHLGTLHRPQAADIVFPHLHDNPV